MTGKQFFLTIFTVVALGAVTKRVWSEVQLWRKRRTSLGWPLTKATILGTSVEEEGMGEFGVRYRLDLSFMYLVGEREYVGSYSEQFPQLHEAERMAAVFKAGPFLVRYNPSAADDHFVDPYRDVREAETSPQVGRG